MREIDGLKIAFVDSKTYFESFHTPSMSRTAKETGADMVILLGENATEADISDETIRTMLDEITKTRGPKT